MSKRRETRQRLEAQRSRVAEQLHGIQDDLEAGIGWVPRGTAAVLLGLAAAAGFALAKGVGRRRLGGGGAQEGDSRPRRTLRDVEK